MLNDASIIVCRCEEVTLADLTEVLDRYRCSAREAKLRTRAGMGFCGGRTCRPLIDRLTGRAIGENEPSPLPLKVQVPVRPVSFGHWGNKP